MKLLRLVCFAVILLAAWSPIVGGAEPVSAPARNLFHDLLGKTDADVDAKIAKVWQQLFYGSDSKQRIYYPVGADMAYMADIGSNDVRSEGMSYGMMIAVQLDHRGEFDRLWRWTKKYMYHADGPRRGYFAWHCRFDGTQIDPGSASDGEEWFAMALLFAAHRWGNGEGIFDYEAEAQALLREMIHKPTAAGVTAIFDRTQHQVVFAPTIAASKLTDPSYHVPAFYELWARWSADPDDRRFWAEAVRTSRDFLQRAAHPRTGLMPEYAYFDGRPHTGFGETKKDFRYDAWRILSNVGVDHAWFPSGPWPVEQSNRALRFLASQGPVIPNQFSLEGKPLSTDSSIGLTAMAAAAGLAADPDVARPFVKSLWDAPIPDGQWRYYNGLLYFLGVLQAGGRYQIYSPPAP